tara:strand:- start:3455 stop:3862 length:408 start_codon:yes stop_codon:yes gene_type:complete
MNLIKVNTIPSIFSRVDNVIDGFFNAYNDSAWSPRCDILENDAEYVISIDVPGIEKKNITIEYQDQTLAISGRRNLDNDQSYYNSIDYGEFNKNFNLPEDANDKGISAGLNSGVLEITIPRKAPIKAKIKKIAIK